MLLNKEVRERVLSGTRSNDEAARRGRRVVCQVGAVGIGVLVLNEGNSGQGASSIKSVCGQGLN